MTTAPLAARATAARRLSRLSRPARLSWLALLAGLAAAAAPPAHALDIPQLSPKASVSQAIGTSEVVIDYHRPGLRGRDVFGGLVPWDEVWRLGANQATTIKLSDDATIAGKPVPAGRYALFARPGRESWTIIVNDEAEQWGTYSHKPEKDRLRFDVKPSKAPTQEWLQFTLTPKGEDTVEVAIAWADVRVAFDVAFEVDALTWKRVDAAIAEQPEDAATLHAAARWAARSGKRQKEGLAWIDKAMAKGEVSAFQHETRARLLRGLGRGDEAAAELAKARKVGEGAKLPREFFTRLDQTEKEWKAAPPPAPAK